MGHSREHIISELRRVAEKIGGTPGYKTFAAETKIERKDWLGIYWARWSDAVREAGLEPNPMPRRCGDLELIEGYARIAREMGRIPVASDLQVARKRGSKTSRWSTISERFGGRIGVMRKLREYCEGKTEMAVVWKLSEGAVRAHEEKEKRMKVMSDEEAMAAADKRLAEMESPAAGEKGFVYLMKSGRFYKIGRTTSTGRRQRELAIELPESLVLIHEIKTDDAAGIEAYWHKRFHAKRMNGEWFDLSAREVGMFKRRKGM